MPQFIEKGNGEVEVSFVITLPMNVYLDFTNKAKKDYGNTYWLLLKDMMQTANMFDNVNNMFADDITQLRNEIEELKQKIEPVLNAYNNEYANSGLGSMARE